MREKTKATLQLVVHKPNRSLIEALEILLEEAKKAEVQSVFYVVEYEDGDTGSGWSFRDLDSSFVRIIGEVSMLESSLVTMENDRKDHKEE